MIYLYIFLVIALLILFYINRSQIIYEDFRNKQKVKKIKKKPVKNIVINQISNTKKTIIPPQNIVLDQSRNKEYTDAEQVKANNYYKLLIDLSL